MKHIQLFIEPNKGIWDKLEKRTFFGGEENFKSKSGEENFMWTCELRIEVHLYTICIKELRIVRPNI